MRWPRSLRWRLALSIAAVLVLAAGATFVAIYRGTGAELRSQIDRELRADSSAFLHRGLPAGAAGPQQVESSARAYVRGQPFRATARLVFVRSVRGGVVTNEPELLTPDHEPGETSERQATENEEARALLTAPPGYSTVSLADVGEVRLLVTPLVRGGGPVGTLGVGEPLESAERAQRGVAGTFLVAGTLTLVAALVAAFLVAAATARPLRRMAAVAARVDAGELSPRMEAAGSPAEEVRVLAESFDHMLDRLEDAFARQREFVADASHELRTPLTVIRGQLEVLARQPDPSPGDVRRVESLVRTEVLRMQRLVEDLLVLARAGEREFLQTRTVELRRFVTELVDGMRATADRRFELGEVPSGTIAADPDRLAQALRNLLRNAIEHTGEGGLVRVTATARGGRVTILVDDDGPGIPQEHRERVFDRFHRTDSSRSRSEGGMGLGLAISQAIVRAHGGRIRAGESPESGARIEVELPGFEPGDPSGDRQGSRTAAVRSSLRIT